MSILIVNYESLREIESNEYKFMDMQTNFYFWQWTHGGGLLVISSIFGEFGSVSTSFKFSGLDDFFWKFMFLAVIVISSSDKWQGSDFDFWQSFIEMWHQRGII
jgi:hypothetical protein